jgi:hypothetical protein
LSVPGVIAAAQAAWLIPALDVRVSAILAGQTPPASNLHALYIGAELAKVLWLLAFGFGDLLPLRRGARRRTGAALRGQMSRHVRDGGLP